VQSSFSITAIDRKKIMAWAKKQDAKVVKMQLKSGQFKDNAITMEWKDYAKDCRIMEPVAGP